MSVRRTVARTVALPAAVAGLGLLAAAPALAHVTVSPSSGSAGSYTVLTFSVPHGCEGSPTTEVAINIPEDVVSVTPTRNPLWDVTKGMVQLDAPIEQEEGDAITERVGSVVYTAKTPLPDGYRDAFELSLQLPEDAAGETLAFPVTQTCVKGETLWNETVAEGQPEPDRPAPTVTVTESTGGGHHGDGDAEASEGSHDEASSHDDSSTGLAWTGIGVGALGLLTAGVALAKSRKARSA